MTYPFYNPREAGGPTLEAMLVGRWPLVEEILADLRRQATSASRQHWLLRGPRGIGKTHLIGVVYHRVREERDLKEAYLPVWLAEMEAYTFYSTAVLLLEVAGQLAEELRRTGDRAGAAAIEEALAGLEAAGDDPALFEEVFMLLQNEARRRGKILLVLMENLDAMLAGFRSQAEARRFRAVLSEVKELLFLSTTPTRYLRQLSDPDEPLYGHLKERKLTTLTEKEVGELFARFAEVSGERRLAGAVGEKGEGRVRRRVLRRLTGGNPRALVMAFSVLSGASGLHSMVEDLEALLDAQTAYFEARLARLAPRERSIVAAMALAPTNLTRQEIASATRLPERSLSTQLKRLLEEGHVDQAVGEGGKGTIYELSDGLFRVWFQYRKGRKKLEPLVRFLALWYLPEELELARAELARATALRSPLERNRAAVVALQVEEALALARSEEGSVEREQLWADVKNEARSEELHELISRAKALVKKGARLGKLGESAKEIAVYEEVVSRFGDRREPALAEVVAIALFNKGVRLGTIGKNAQEIAVYEEVVSRYGDRRESALAELAAMAILNKGVRLGALRESAKEIAAYEEVVCRYGDRQEPALAELVAFALFNKGVRLGELGESGQALAIFEEVVSRYAEDREIPIQRVVIWASLYLAETLGLEGKPREAIRAYRDFVTRLEAIKDLEFRELAPLSRHVLTALEAAQPRRRGARGKKGPAARLREALGRVPPELRDTVREIAETILFGKREKGDRPDA